MAGETIIGAKLSLTGATAAIRNVNAYADAMERATAATDKFAESAAAAAEKEGALADATKAQAGATRSAIVATTASTEKTEAQTAENASVIKGTKAIKEAEKAHVGFSNTVNSIAASSVGKFGKWGALGALGLSYEGIKQYQSYQYQITQLMTQAGVQQKNLAGLYAGGLTISKETGLKLATVGNQLYRIASARAGLHATNAELLSLSKQAANVSVLFNTAPGGQTEQVARIFGALATARTSGLRTVGSDRHMGALVNATVGGSDIRGSTLIGALGRGVLQSGSAVGASLPTILAWIGASTKFGAQASSSGTLIAHSLQQLATPSAQGQAAEAMFGIKQGELKSLISHQGIRAAISDFLDKIEGGGLHVTATMPSTLSQRTKGMTNRQDALTKLLSWGLNRTLLAKLTAGGPLSKNTQSALLQFIMTKAFGGARQEIPLLTLTQSHVFTSTLTYIKKHATTKNFQKDLIKAYSTPQQQQKIVEANLMASLVQVGHAIDPMWIKFLHGLLDVVNYFVKNSGALKALVWGFAGLTSVGLGAVALKHVLSWIDAFKRINQAVSNSRLLKGLFGTSQTTGLAGNTGALDTNTGALSRLTAVIEGKGLGGGPGGVGGSAAGSAEGAGAGALAGEEGAAAAGGIAGTGLSFAAFTAIAAAGFAAGYEGARALGHHSTGFMKALTTPSRWLTYHLPTWLGGINPNSAGGVTYTRLHASQVATQRTMQQHPQWYHYAAPKNLTTALKSYGIPWSERPVPQAATEPQGTKLQKPSKEARINAYWQAALRTAVDTGHYNFLQAMIASGTQMPQTVAKTLGLKGGTYTSAQALRGATFLRGLTQTQQFEYAAAAYQAQQKATHIKTVEANARRAKEFETYVAGQDTGAGMMNTWIAGGIAHGAQGPLAPRGTSARVIENAQNAAAAAIAKIGKSHMDAQTKVAADAAAIQKVAANVMHDAAKKHGEAAAAEKEAAQMFQDAANGIKNIRVSVDINNKALVKAVSTGFAQTHART